MVGFYRDCVSCLNVFYDVSPLWVTRTSSIWASLFVVEGGSNALIPTDLKVASGSNGFIYHVLIAM